jgi:uncharacterized protein
VLSDLHIGSPHVGLDKLEQIVNRTNAERPELVVLLGDFVIGGPVHSSGVPGGGFVTPDKIAAALRKLDAPYGVFAVLGNHDWWYDGPRVNQALSEAGIQVLENRAVPMSGFWLAGIADLWTSAPNARRALTGVTDNAPVIAITHNPDVFPEIPSRVTLTIAGHTHGGQVNLPFIGTLISTSEFGFVSGFYMSDERRLFVTTGIGTSILPVRFRVPPEIVILTLTK